MNPASRPSLDACGPAQVLEPALQQLHDALNDPTPDLPAPAQRLPLQTAFSVCNARASPLSGRLLDVELVGASSSAGTPSRCLCSSVELAAASDYFVALAQFQQGQPAGPLPSLVLLPALEHTHVCHLVDSLYAGAVVLAPANIAGWLAAACYLQVNAAVRAGEAYLRGVLLLYYPGEVIAAAAALGLRRVLKAAGRLVRRQFLRLADVHGLPAIASWLALMPKAQVRSIFAAEDIQVPSEFALVELACRLSITAARVAGVAGVKELLGSVRFETMRQEELWLASLFVRQCVDLPSDLALWLQGVLMDATMALGRNLTYSPTRQLRRDAVFGRMDPPGCDAAGRGLPAGSAGTSAPAVRTLPAARASVQRTLRLAVDFASLEASMQPSETSPGVLQSRPTLLVHRDHLYSLSLSVAPSPSSQEPGLFVGVAYPQPRLPFQAGALPAGFACAFAALTAQGLQVEHMAPLDQPLQPGEGAGLRAFLAAQRGRAARAGGEELVLCLATIPQ